MPELDIAARKDAAIARLEALHASLGAAILDGKKPPHDEIEEAERELQALGEAEAEVVRRERAAAAAADTKRLAALRKRIGAEFEGYQEDWKRFESALRSMAGAIDGVLTRSSAIRTAAKEMRVRVPASLAPNVVERRLSEWIIALLRGRAPGTLGGFGNIDLPSSPMGVTRDADIAKVEKDLVSPDIRILKGTLR